MKTLSIYWPLRVQELEQMACITVPKKLVYFGIFGPTHRGLYFSVTFAYIQSLRCCKAKKLHDVHMSAFASGGFLRMGRIAGAMTTMTNQEGGQNSWQGKTIEDIKTSG